MTAIVACVHYFNIWCTMWGLSGNEREKDSFEDDESPITEPSRRTVYSNENFLVPGINRHSRSLSAMIHITFFCVVFYC